MGRHCRNRKTANFQYSSKRLTIWGKLITKVTDVESIDVANDREKIKVALNKWYEVWAENNVIAAFNELPDDVLNTRIWYISVNIEKSFGSVANSLRSFCDEKIPLDICLHRISDAFTDSEEDFAAREKDLEVLKSFSKTALKRKEIWSYLAICEKNSR